MALFMVGVVKETLERQMYKSSVYMCGRGGVMSPLLLINSCTARKLLDKLDKIKTDTPWCCFLLHYGFYVCKNLDCPLYAWNVMRRQHQDHLNVRMGGWRWDKLNEIRREGFKSEMAAEHEWHENMRVHTAIPSFKPNSFFLWNNAGIANGMWPCTTSSNLFLWKHFS